LANSFFSELKRRNVFKVATAYLAGSWLTVEVAGTLLSTFGIDESAMRFVIITLAIGLLPVLIFSWTFEITSEGIKSESEIKPEDSIAIHTGQKLNIITFALLVIALGYFIYESRFQTQPSTVNDSGVEVESVSENSIAVLPFVNMSSDKEQEYFSDGISEEILNVLAKIPKLKVTSRSSAFAFKGKDINVSVIAKKLGVRNILEGSVRKSGTRVRVTALLINAGTDTHLWSETYDRKLTTDNIFDIQDEISSAIVNTLKSKLGLDVAVVARDKTVVNLDAHNEYLQGRFFIEKRKQEELERALQHFNKSIELAPDYAVAWAGKAWANLFLSESRYGNLPHWAALERARPAAVKALELDPNLTEANAIMGLLESINQESDDAIVYYDKAIVLNPNYADAYNWLSNEIDDPDKILELRKKAVQLNPLSLQINFNYAQSLLNLFQSSMAEQVATDMKSINANDYRVYIIFREIRRQQKRWGEVAYYSEKIQNLNQKADISGVSGALANIGFIDKAEKNESDAEDNYYYHLYRGNEELFIKSVLAEYSEPELDTDDTFLLLETRERAYAEYLAEKYSEAVKYYLPSGDKDPFRFAFSYQQLGKEIEANEVLYTWKLQSNNAKTGNDSEPQFLIDYSVGRREPINSTDNIMTLGIDYESLDLLVLEGKIEAAIQLLTESVEKGAILLYWLKIEPLYTQLRDHPQWQSIVEQSNATIEKHRQIYLQLIASETAG